MAKFSTARSTIAFAVGAGALALMGVLFFYPLGTVLLRGLSEITTSGLWSDPYYFHVIRFTYYQAFWSTVLASLVGTIGALIFSESVSRWSRVWTALSLIPFSLPTILVVLALLRFWGRQGWAGALWDDWAGIYGWPGILIAHAFFNFPLFVQGVGLALRETDRTQERVALSLGASRLTCWREITWPCVRTAFWSSCLLCFLFCASSFLVVLLLGGGPRFTTLEVAIYQSLKSDFDLALAVRLALIQVGVTCVLSLFLVGHRPTATSRQGRALRLYTPRSPRLRSALSGLYFLLLLVWVALPLLLLLLEGIAQWHRLSVSGWYAIRRSLQLAFAVGFLSTFLALLIEYSARHIEGRWVRRLASVAVTLPLGVSTLLLLLGWRLAQPGWTQTSVGAWCGVVFVQTVLSLPIVYRCVQAGFSRIAEPWYAQARSLGASPFRIFRWVELPLLQSSLSLGFLLGASISLGEAGAVLLFLDESTMNLTFQIYQSMSRYRFDEAAGLSAVLIVLTGLIALAMLRLERKVAR